MPTKKMALAAPVTPEQTVIDAVAASASGSKLTAKQLANIADIWWEFYQQRLAADKVAAKLKITESAAQALIIEQLRMQELTAIGGAKVRLAMDPEPTYEPHVTDWPAYYAHIVATNDFSLLERRPGRAACKERWEDGKIIPGVEKFPVYKFKRNEVK